jgi:pimeloyl-ACP methyl ester carboxylesterase
MLNTLSYGNSTQLPDLLIVHGLYGSARNWSVISKRMSDSRRVIAVDQRNHGDSPWFDTHSYLDMAQDLAQVVEHNGAPMDIVGHSMGGKAAMILALTRPDLVKRLLVADIAPVAYGYDQSQYIQAMQSIDLTHMEKRSEVAQALSKHVTDPALQSFFTQSLDLGNKRWKLNLDVLQRDMHHVLGFPEVTGSFDKPTLFLSGANSQYVLPDHRPKIKALFPNAVFAKIPNAGHWLHAEQPRAFEQTLRVFFNDPA